MLELAVKLAVVTLVIVGGLLLAARASRRGGRSGTEIRVSGRHGIGRNAALAVVEVDGRRFLVGAGEQQVSLLTELDPVGRDPDLLDLTAPTSSTTDAVAPRDRTTAARLGSALVAAHRHSRRPHGTGPSPTTGPGIGPLDRLRAMTVRSHLHGEDPGLEPPIHVQPPPT